MPATYQIKLCFIGEFAVGKTSLIKSFVKGTFNKDYIPTIGANLFAKTIAVKSKTDNYIYEVNLNIWDIAGQQSWATMRKSYYKGGQGIFVVADLTRPKTFQQVAEYWIDDLQKEMGKDIPVILLANKDDLNSQVQESDYLQIKQTKQIKEVYRTSAKEGTGFSDALLKMIEYCIGNPELEYTKFAKQ